jgi:hypothetical protein
MSGSPANPQSGVWYDVRNTLADNINLKKIPHFLIALSSPRISPNLDLQMVHSPIQMETGVRVEISGPN